MTSPLSPAAQAVMNAFVDSPIFEDEDRIAAALRAAANHGEHLFDPTDGKIAVVRVADLQAWAAELEGSNA